MNFEKGVRHVSGPVTRAANHVWVDQRIKGGEQWRLSILVDQMVRCVPVQAKCISSAS